MEEDFFVIVCPSTDSDIISRISVSVNPASFKASMLSRKLADSRCSAKNNREKLGVVRQNTDR